MAVMPTLMIGMIQTTASASFLTKLAIYLQVEHSEELWEVE